MNRTRYLTDELMDSCWDLVSKADEDYRLFNSKLIPTEDTSLGVRIPVLRKMAVEIAKGNGAAFLDIPKGNCHEEILLEGFVLGRYRCGYDEFIRRTNSFCHRLTNWANCDSVCILKAGGALQGGFFSKYPSVFTGGGRNRPPVWHYPHDELLFTGWVY
ncbi:MAG: hypothetical protein ACLTA1_02640 [Clostridia bacterium]